MQLSTRDGISCDHCGTQYRKVFEYYSVDMRDGVSQQGHTIPIDIIRRRPVTFGFDLCSLCYNGLTQIVVANYKPVPRGVVCDLTGISLNDSFHYHYVDITKVNVKVLPTGKAEIVTSPRELELVISVLAGTELVNKVLQCRKDATAWTTSTTKCGFKELSGHESSIH